MSPKTSERRNFIRKKLINPENALPYKRKPICSAFRKVFRCCCGLTPLSSQSANIPLNCTTRALTGAVFLTERSPGERRALPAWVNRGLFGQGQNSRLFALLRLCCKSLKSRCDNFPARRQDRP